MKLFEWIAPVTARGRANLPANAWWVVAVALVLLVARVASAETNGKPTMDESLKVADANPIDKPGRPRVLLIGDSISYGYTIPVRQNLKDQANVHRVLGNCQDTANSLGKLNGWLGTNRWDVIHFNWGIWDTHGFDRKTGQPIQLQDEGKFAPAEIRCRNNLDQYRENLTQLVGILKGTGARLIWASTTPITARTGPRFDVISNYNAVAAEIMKANGVAVDDLYALALPAAAQWQQGDGCHFTPQGSEPLGKQVSQSILAALKQTPLR